MSGFSKLLLPVVLVSWALAGCAYEGASYSPSLGLNSNAGTNSTFEPSTEMTPYPAPGADYYTDNWNDAGNGQDGGQFSNW
jgi:hypothetical protein